MADSTTNNPSPAPNASDAADEAATGSKAPPQRDPVTTSQLLFSSQDTSSPQKKKAAIMANATTDGKDKNDLQREAVGDDLGEVHVIPMADAEKIYESVAPDKAIDTFFSKTELYKSGRWVDFPSKVPKENLLYDIFVAVSNVIFTEFNPELPKGVSRVAVNTHNVRLRHDNPDDYTSPDICINASGYSFEVTDDPGNTQGIGYAGVASVIDGKREENMSNSVRVHAKQLGVYVKEILARQPNRNSVSAMIFTQDRCRLLRFDRSGVLATPLFNFHTRTGKVLFVRYILGISSPNEAMLGLDTSVQWVIGNDGKKKSGTITVFDEKKQLSVIYDLNMKVAPTVRPGIRCRGTVGWHAKDRTTGMDVFIKDSWRSGQREPEYNFLLKANQLGLPGIPELLMYQDNLTDTVTIRSDSAIFAKPGLNDFFKRTKLRMVMKQYGPSVWFFRSRIQLFSALRDVVIAHRDLLTAGILHRDIAVPNLLLGTPGASEGSKGLLVDLDMAIYVWRLQSEVSADPRSGYRVYQSISSLLSSPGWSPAHNYMDDMEGIFYSLHHVMHHFQRPGVRVRDMPPILQSFRLDENFVVAQAKLGLIHRTSKTFNDLSSYWGDTCKSLLRSFREAIRSMVLAQDEIRESEMGADTKNNLLKHVCVQRAKGDYETIIKIFDTAILALREEGLNKEELEPYPEDPEPYPLHRPADHDLKAPSPTPNITPFSQTHTMFGLDDDMLRLLAHNRLESQSGGSNKLKRRIDDPDLQPESSKRHQGSLGQSSLRNLADLRNDSTPESDVDDSDDAPEGED